MGPIIENRKYEYIHLLGHSAGARLIDVTAKRLADYYRPQTVKPFIHLTFLDAFQPFDDDYGKLPGYPNQKHYAEHYVDRGLTDTDSCLKHAFNLDITDWTPDKDDGFGEFGHQWPLRWYKKSVRLSSEFEYAGFHLSFEGGNVAFNQLHGDYPHHTQCKLSSVNDVKKECKPSQCW